MYTLFFTQKFDKDIKRLSKNNAQVVKKIKKLTKLLKNDINHPSLRLHKLQNKDTWSISLDRSIRVIIYIEGQNIYFLRVGTHDEVY